MVVRVNVNVYCEQRDVSDGGSIRQIIESNLRVKNGIESNR